MKEGEVFSKLGNQFELTTQIQNRLNEVLELDIDSWTEIQDYEEVQQVALELDRDPESLELKKIVESSPLIRKVSEINGYEFDGRSIELMEMMLDQINVLPEEVHICILEALRNFQRKRMTMLRVDPVRQNSALIHEDAVVDLVQRTDESRISDKKFLSWVSMIHDIAKYTGKSTDFNDVLTQDQYLGLHEVGSAMVVGKIMEALLLSLESKLAKDMEDDKYFEAVNNLSKLAELAVLNHGRDEFPDLQSKNRTILELEGIEVRKLFEDQVYIGGFRDPRMAFKDRWPRFEPIVEGLREADMMSGCTLQAIDKYNRGTSNKVLKKFDSVEAYLKSLLASVDSNFEKAPDVLGIRDLMGVEELRVLRLRKMLEDRGLGTDRMMINRFFQEVISGDNMGNLELSMSRANFDSEVSSLIIQA